MSAKRFAVIPKQQETTNPFFAIVHEGCATRANDLGVICDFEGPIHPIALDQLEIIRKKINENIDGIAISSLDDNITQIAVQEALAKTSTIRRHQQFCIWGNVRENTASIKTKRRKLRNRQCDFTQYTGAQRWNSKLLER